MVKEYTEEERKKAKRKSNKKYYSKHKEKCLENQKKYYKKNKEEKLEYAAEYRQNNKEKIDEYRQNNKDKIDERRAEYRKTPIGRAIYLVQNYKQQDKIHNRGECTLTPEWIIENIFTQPCKYCGKTGHEVVGCNRIDNSKPHTPDNVEPCCMKCNVELYNPKKKLAKINPVTKEIVEIYESISAARKDGYTHAEQVAKGKRKKDKGYIFEYLI